METEDKKIKVVTFQNHFGAQKLKKALGDICSLRAVPRALSSSCGTCAFVEDAETAKIIEVADSELLEGIYEKREGGFVRVYGNDC